MVSSLKETAAAGVCYHEQIYTSADRLLESASGHLGVVASTRDFPRELAAVFEPLRSYTILAQLPIDQPARHPCRLVLGPAGGQNQWYCITQVCFAGADHTGRTTPLAHHAAIQPAELAEHQVPPAVAIEQIVRGMAQRWREAPRWIDPPRHVSADSSLLTDGDAIARHFDSEDMRLAVLAACDVLVSYGHNHRPAVFAIDAERPEAAIELIFSILQNLPVSIQRSLNCASHVVERNEVPRDCGLIVTYPDAPYWLHAQQRGGATRPWMCDLTAVSVALPEPCGPFAVAVMQDTHVPGAKGGSDIASLWDKLEFDASQAVLFPAAVSIARGVRHARSLRELAAVSSELEEFGRAKPTEATLRRIEELCLQAVERSAEEKSGERWAMLGLIATDGRWPTTVQQSALYKLAEQSDRAVPKLLDLQPSPWLSQRSINVLLSKLTTESAGLVERVIKHAVKNPSSQTSQWTATILSLAVANGEQLLRWSNLLSGASKELQNVAIPVLQGRLHALAATAPELAGLWHLGRTNAQGGDSIANQLVQSLVSSRLDQCSDVSSWRDYASLWLEAEASKNRLPEAIASLAARYREKITPDVVQHWRGMAQRLGCAVAMNEALGRAELLAPPRPTTDYVIAVNDVELASVKHPSPAPFRRKVPQRSSPRGVGPILSIAILAILALGLQTAVAIIGGKSALWPVWGVMCVIIVLTISWGATEIFVMDKVLSASRLASLRWARRIALMLICASALASGGLLYLLIGVQPQNGSVDADWLESVKKQFFSPADA